MFEQVSYIYISFVVICAKMESWFSYERYFIPFKLWANCFWQIFSKLFSNLIYYICEYPHLMITCTRYADERLWVYILVSFSINFFLFADCRGNYTRGSGTWLNLDMTGIVVIIVFNLHSYCALYFTWNHKTKTMQWHSYIHSASHRKKRKENTQKVQYIR